MTKGTQVFLAIAATAGWTISGGAVSVVAVQDMPAVQERLNAKIPAADPKKYKAIRDAKDWLNPKVIIRAEGVEILTSTIPSGRTTIPVSELRRFLISLPLRAWAVRSRGSRIGRRASSG